ncbi:site-specific integrase [Methanobacterium formicicum]|nr:hypothetical protein [Methanobacterium formicicum]
MKVEDDLKFRQFADQRSLKPSTIKKYVTDFGIYTKVTGLTLTELITEAREEQKKIEYEDERKVTKYLLDYKQHLKEIGRGDYSIKNAIISVKGFYNHFKIQTPKMNISAVPSTYYLNVDELPKHKDIKLIFKHCDIRFKALVSHLASSGMSISDTLDLKVYDLFKAVNYHGNDVNSLNDLYQLHENDKSLIPVWKSKRTKNQNPYVTFTTPEAFGCLIDYLKFSTPNTEDSYLFRRYDVDGKLGYSTVAKKFATLNEKSKMDDKKVGSSRFITAKAMRTFFAITLEQCKVPDQHIRRMMGHTQRGIRQSYQKLDISLLLEFYLTAIDALTFSKKVQVIDHTAEIVKKQDAKIENLEAMVSALMEDKLKGNK